jgi:hypothetical protein
MEEPDFSESGMDPLEQRSALAELRDDASTPVHSLDITPEMRDKSMLEGMPMFARAEAGPAPLETTSLFPEVQKRKEAARGLGGRVKLKEKILEKATEFLASWRRHFQHINPDATVEARFGKRLIARADMGDLANVLRLHEAIPEYSKNKAKHIINDILGGLDEKEYEVFSEVVILSDLMKDIESGLLDAENLQEGETLPFGYRSREEVELDLAHFQEQAAKSEAIAGALEKREQIITRMREDLVHYGLLDKKVLNDPAYFHHQVLEMWGIRKWTGTGTSSKDVRTHRKGWQMARTGHLGDYNTEYMEAEFEVLAQGIAQIETKKTLDRIDRKANIIGKLRRMAKSWNESRCMEIFQEAGMVERTESEDRKTGEIIVSIKTPFTPFHQKIARGFSELQKMADRGELEGPDEFSEAIDLLAEGEMGGKVFPYLAWLVSTGNPGAPSAARIFKGIKGKEALIKQTLGDQLKTFHDMVPDGYTVWKPEPNTAWYLTNTITDKVLDQIRTGEKSLEDPDVKKALARGVDTMWVIPEDLAATLNDFRPHRDEGPLGKASVTILNAWKQWVLINPFRVLKYNMNNLSGDFDICWAYDPKIVKEYAWKAAKDLLAYTKNKEVGRDLRQEFDTAFRQGILNSGMTVHDITDITDHMAMDGYLDVLAGRKVSFISKFWNTSKKFTTYRENVLRLAAWRYFRERIDRGDQGVYGVSKMKQVDQIRSGEDRAALLARELVGDYGNLSVAGQWLRTKMIPFWSFQEINAPRYVRLFYNLAAEGRGRGDLAKVGALAMARKGAGLTAKVFTFYGMAMLWNIAMAAVLGIDDDDLSDAERRQLHLILGRREDGTIITLRLQGAISEALSWVGLENILQDAEDVAAGRKTKGEQAKEMAWSPFNKLVNAAHPFIKLAGEEITGYSVFPDITNPRPIKDRVEHLARMFSLESPYRHMTGKPTRKDWKDLSFWDDVINLVGHQSDPGEAAYFDTRQRARKFLERKGIDSGSYRADAHGKSMALYNYKKALQYGDLDVAKKYYDRYMVLGGSRKGLKISVRMASPIAAVPKKMRREFLDSLTPRDRAKYERAVKWYNEVYGGGKAYRRPVDGQDESLERE